MSCDVAAAAFLHYAALVRTGAAGFAFERAAVAPAPRSQLSREPLFASIVSTARDLQAQADLLRSSPQPLRPEAWASFEARVAKLSELDMQGHLELAKRGTDGDLKCILRGISQDLPKKLAAVDAAATPQTRKAALDETYFLLRDNVEVITTPPAQTSSDVVRKG